MFIGEKTFLTIAPPLRATDSSWWAMRARLLIHFTVRWAWTGFHSPAFLRIRLILAQQKGEPITELVEKHNRTFSRSYERWFQGIYKDRVVDAWVSAI